MARDLYRIDAKKWIVVDGDEVHTFDSVDAACDHLENSGIPEAEVNHALTDLTINGNSRAHFGDVNGSFILSDSSKYLLQ